MPIDGIHHDGIACAGQVGKKVKRRRAAEQDATIGDVVGMGEVAGVVVVASFFGGDDFTTWTGFSAVEGFALLLLFRLLTRLVKDAILDSDRIVAQPPPPLPSADEGL